MTLSIRFKSGEVHHQRADVGELIVPERVARRVAVQGNAGAQVVLAHVVGQGVVGRLE